MLYKEIHREKLRRDDGWLSELISMKYDDQPFSCLHSYLVSITPGRSRADHYHDNKEEWVAIASGRLDLHLEDARTKERACIHLDAESDDYRMIYIPQGVAHLMVNTAEGESSVIVFSRFPEKAGDTVPYEVRR